MVYWYSIAIDNVIDGQFGILWMKIPPSFIDVLIFSFQKQIITIFSTLKSVLLSDLHTSSLTDL